MHFSILIHAISDWFALAILNAPEAVIDVVAVFVLNDFSLDLNFAIRITLPNDFSTILGNVTFLSIHSVSRRCHRRRVLATNFDAGNGLQWLLRRLHPKWIGNCRTGVSARSVSLIRLCRTLLRTACDRKLETVSATNLANAQVYFLIGN